MTNSQQLAAEPAAEQAQEEQVQLTELRPVEHSRINGAADEKDSYVTDGLKALRSFSRRQLDEFEQFGSGYPRKRKHERWRHIEETNEFGVLDEVAALKKRHCAEHKAVGHENALDNGLDSDEFDVEEDDDYYGVNGDFEYLNENSSEVYVYKQQDSESGIDESLELAKDEEVPEEPVKAPEEAARAAKSPSPEIPVVVRRPRGRPPKKKRKVIEKNKKKKTKDAAEGQEELGEKKKDASAEKEASSTGLELQNKINDIIQAKILMAEEEEEGEAEEEEEEEEEEERNNNEEKGVRERSKCASQKEEAQPKKYSCELCDARFKGSGGLRNHLKVVHSSGPLFKCDECGKEFPLKERLKLHVRTHTGFKPYECAECDKRFARGGQLVQHRRTHSQVKPYSCELCPGTFTCAANLSLHVKRHNNQKDHKCEICGRGFVRRDALKKHLECLHRDVKSFLCVICNKTFKGHLPQHMRTHAQDRPHGCATCGQRFAQKSQLTVHQRTHSGQRPFRCLVCWQAFAHSTALKLHTRRHTGERPFKCAECNAGFTQLPHWKKHMKCIHGRSEPYSCRNCKSFFRIKSELESHAKECQSAESAREELSDQSSNSGDGCGSLSASAIQRYRNMSIEKMRLLLAVLLKRISKPERLDELGFGKRLIDDVLVDSLLSAGKTAVKTSEFAQEFETLQANLEVFLEWTVPKEHWDNFRRMKKTPEEVLEALTGT